MGGPISLLFMFAVWNHAFAADPYSGCINIKLRTSLESLEGSVTL